MKHNNFFLIVLLFICLYSNTRAQIWKPVTTDNFYYPGNTAGVASMVVDSATNTLIVGGLFDSIGSVPAKNIARWDGVNFTPIGIGFPYYLTCLAIFNGDIYASGVSATDFKIYKYDGISWSVFANPNGRVQCLKVHNGKLYVGGSFFMNIGATLLKGIGVYDGVTWSDIGGGVDDPACGWCSHVKAIEFIDSVIYIGGIFATAGSTPVSNIAMWNGVSWSAMGSGVTGPTGIYDGWVSVLKEYNNELYAGGNFYSAGGIPCHIAKWNGINWSMVGDGLSNYTLAMLVFDGKLYSTGGGYSGTNYVSHPANWDGISWNQTGAIPLGGGNPLCAYNSEIYGGISGWFFNGTDTIKVLARFGELEFQTQNTICGNNCNGTATISDSVGVPPHSYLWSNGATTKTVSGLCPGVYTVSVTDGGDSVTEGSVTIGGPPAIQLTPILTNANCGTCNDGSISIGLSGGTGLFNVQWSNGDSTNAINNLSFGSYSVTVTDSMGCYVEDTFLVSYVNSTQSQSTDVNCFSQCTGTASTVSTGVAPLVFEWNNGATTDSVLNLCAGIYYVTITDSNGVAASDTIVITEPTQLLITDTSTNASCSTCNNGSATVNVNGGTPPFSYVWSNGATTNEIEGLLPGGYSVTITDNNGCVMFDSVTVGFDVGSGLQVADYKLQIYPNPANETVTITADNINEVVVTNLLGEIVQSSKYKVQSNTATIDISKLLQGIYLLRVQTNNGWQVGKVVKE